jgi:hypothetical protein
MAEKRSAAANRLFRIIAQLDSHFSADHVPSADANNWLELRRALIRMKDGLGLARIELESDVRPPEERIQMALKHVRFGLGEVEL